MQIEFGPTRLCSRFNRYTILNCDPRDSGSLYYDRLRRIEVGPLRWIMILPIQFYITTGILALAIGYKFPCFSLLSAYICSIYSPAYGVFISQLIRYARACSSYECFLRAARHSCKYLGQGYVKECLKSSLWRFCCRYGDLIKQYEVTSPKCYMTFWDMIIYTDTFHWSDISLNRDLVTELDLITVFDIITLFREVSTGDLQRMRLANRGSFLLRSLGPVPYGTCICSKVETIHSWTCLVYGLFEFRTSLGTSILLLAGVGLNLQRQAVSSLYPLNLLIRSQRHLNSSMTITGVL